jgi:hypothetical protein
MRVTATSSPSTASPQHAESSPAAQVLSTWLLRSGRMGALIAVGLTALILPTHTPGARYSKVTQATISTTITRHGTNREARPDRTRRRRARRRALPRLVSRGAARRGGKHGVPARRHRPRQPRQHAPRRGISRPRRHSRSRAAHALSCGGWRRALSEFERHARSRSQVSPPPRRSGLTLNPTARTECSSPIGQGVLSHRALEM